MGDELVGSDWKLRRWLEEQKRPYVPGVRGNRHVTVGTRQVKVADLARSLPKRSWHEVTIAPEGKGPRRYARAWFEIDHDLAPW